MKYQATHDSRGALVRGFRMRLSARGFGVECESDDIGAGQCAPDRAERELLAAQFRQEPIGNPALLPTICQIDDDQSDNADD